MVIKLGNTTLIVGHANSQAGGVTALRWSFLSSAVGQCISLSGMVPLSFRRRFFG